MKRRREVIEKFFRETVEMPPEDIEKVFKEAVGVFGPGVEMEKLMTSQEEEQFTKWLELRYLALLNITLHSPDGQNHAREVMKMIEHAHTQRVSKN